MYLFAIVVYLCVKLTESIVLVFVKLAETRIILGKVKLFHYIGLTQL